MSNLLALLHRLHQGTLKTNRPLPLSEQHFNKLAPWPEPKSVSIRRLKAFDRFDIRPTTHQLSEAASTYMHRNLWPVIVDDEAQVLLGQLRVAGLRKHFGPLLRVHAVRYSELSEAQIVFMVRDMISLINRKDAWDNQMLAIDCQGLTALVSKTAATARTRTGTMAGARSRSRVFRHVHSDGIAAGS